MPSNNKLEEHLKKNAEWLYSTNRKHVYLEKICNWNSGCIVKHMCIFKTCNIFIVWKQLCVCADVCEFYIEYYKSEYFDGKDFLTHIFELLYKTKLF